MSSPFLHLCYRELRRILGDQRIYGLLLAGPFFYAFAFGGVYWEGRTKYVPIVIVDEDHSALSRDITRALQSSDSVSVAGWLNSPEEFLPLLRRERAYACVIFPPKFEHDVLDGRAPRVGALFDGSHVLIAATALGAIRNVVTSFQVAVNGIELSTAGVPRTEGRVLARPIQAVIRPVFNPTLNYSYFMLMCLVCVATQSVTRMSCGIALGLDSSEQIRRDTGNDSTPILWVFLSKVVGTAALVIPAAATAMWFVFVLFGAPNRGNALLIGLALSLFVIIQVCIAYGYYGLFQSPVLCTQFHMFTAVLFSILSGYTWPYYGMPEGLQFISMSIPVFNVISIVRRVSLMGAGPSLLTKYFLALLVWLLVAAAWGYWAVRKQMKLESAPCE